MTDLLGPAAAGAPRALASSDPSITATIQFPDAADTWFQDCVNNTSGTGTPYVAEWANRQLQQIRRAIRNSGAALTYADDQLGYAIQQGLQWVGTLGGTPNAVTATMAPAQPTLVAGTEIKGLVAATNTGAATLNVNGGGSFPITGADGTALIGGEMVIGGAASFIYTGTSFVLLSPGPSIFQRILSVNTTYFINNSTGSDSTGNGLTSGTAWATITHALKVISTFNLGGNTITIQLGLTGVAYVGPGSFADPSNGTVIIRGDPAAQASYLISATPTSGLPVLQSIAGTLILVGLTVKNLATAANTFAVGAVNSSLLLQNVTLSSTGGVSYCLVSSSGAAIGIGPGCIFTGNAAAALFVENGGSLSQQNNAVVSGSPTYSTAFMSAVSGATFSVGVSGLSWSGTCTGTRYSAALNGVINTAGGGASFFPGTVAGTTATGGQYA